MNISMNMRLTRRTLTIICTSAIMLAGIVLTACGNPRAATDGTPGISPVATEPTELPTIQESPAPDGAIPTPGAPVTPVPVTPVAASGPRPDCEQGWAATTDTRISVCYPSDAAVTRGEKPDYVAYNVVTNAASVTPEHAVFLAIGIESTPSISPGSTCDGASPLYSAHDFSQQGMQLPVGDVVACLASGSDGSESARSMMFSLPVAGGFLNVAATYRGGDAGADFAEINSVLTSLRLP